MAAGLVHQGAGDAAAPVIGVGLDMLVPAQPSLVENAQVGNHALVEECPIPVTESGGDHAQVDESAG